MRIVLIGPPGAGKGTQAEQLSRHLAIPHISTGDLFRRHLSEKTSLGTEAKRYMDAGRLVPDDVTVGMVRARLTEPDSAVGFILDGFPRNLVQAEALAEALEDLDVDVDVVVEFTVTDEAVVARMLSRGRSDDTADVILHRLEVYRTETAPVLEYYRDRTRRIDADGPVDEVAQQLTELLTSLRESADALPQENR